MIEQTRPRIGMTMRIELETDRFYLARYYSEAVEAAGGLPVHIPLIPKSDFINGIVDGLDGLLLPGSDSDMDPQRYGREPRQQLGTVHPLKDETDLLVLAEIEKLAASSNAKLVERRRSTTTLERLFLDETEEK